MTELAAAMQALTHKNNSSVELQVFLVVGGVARNADWCDQPVIVSAVIGQEDVAANKLGRLARALAAYAKTKAACQK